MNESLIQKKKYNINHLISPFPMSGMEQVMIHSSSFLLPSIPADEASAYAIVVLNQKLPRFTPLLWEHGTPRLLSF